MYELPIWITDKLSKLNGNLKLSYSEISRNYRQQQYKELNKDQVLAYAIGRMPATYSVINYVIQKFLNKYKLFSNVLDIGSGCGSLAIALLDKNVIYTALEKSTSMINMFKILLGEDIKVFQQDIYSYNIKNQYEAIFASYCVNEMKDKEFVLKKIFDLSSRYVFIIEPGTPIGYSNIISAKKVAKEKGFHSILPCSMDICHLKNKDWCHFSIRVQRNKIHTNIKRGSLPYEDEKFSYVIFSKNRLDDILHNTIIKRPIRKSGHSIFDVCTQNGIKRLILSNKSIKQKLYWGDEINLIK